MAFRPGDTALLVSNEDGMRNVTWVDFIVKLNKRTATISKDYLDALTAETLQEGFRARALNFCHHSHLSTYPFVGPETKKPPSHAHSGREAGL